MATILNIEDFLDAFEIEEVEDEPTQDKKVSLWVKNKDIYTPSADIQIVPILPPGMYTVEYDSNTGHFCKPINLETDELFVFTESIAQELLDEISLFWDKKELYKENNLVHKRGILLYGFPGTGKSSYINMLSEALIKEGGVVFKITGIRNLFNYIEFLKNNFRKIQKDTNIITILEDIDQYKEVEVELLDFLDGQSHLNHHVVIATSNNTEHLPDTFLRPSRLDLKIEVPMPTEQTRKEYFINKKVPEDLLDNMVLETKGCSLADLKEIYICVFLLDYTVERAVKQILEPHDKKSYLDNHSRKRKIGL